MKKGNRTMIVLCSLVAFVIVAVVIFGVANFFRPNGGIPMKDVVTEAEDTETNLSQREYLFNYVGLDSSNYEITNSETHNGNISQWWYKDSTYNNSGVYIAIGNLMENEHEGFAEFGDSIPAISDTDEYLLEISVGNIGVDGYLNMSNGTRSYYFIQTGDNIEFVNLEIAD